jgi:hypothetical protein
MGILDDPTNPFAIESLRRSIVMTPDGQHPPIDRDRALALLEELQRLQEERKAVAVELRAVLSRLEQVGWHPSGG